MPSTPKVSEPKIQQLSESNFIEQFCSSESKRKFQEPIEEVFNYSRRTGAKNVFFGGSFITEKVAPNDIDILIAYEKDEQIPRKTQNLDYANINLDILFCSYEDANILDAYLAMFGYDRFGNERSVIQIIINEKSEKHQFSGKLDQEIIDVVQATYNGRKVVQKNEQKGLLVSIHGLYSKAEWNFDIAPIASSQGWIFAPYVFEGNNWELIINKSKRQKTIDNFREWIYDICQRYSRQTRNLSIVAHSYGTFIIGKYLNGFDKLPINLNALILTGSVLNKSYDWDSHFNDSRIGTVLNIYSPNDRVIKKMPNWKHKRIIGIDPLFGSAGYTGFSCKNNRLHQRNLNILNHTNTIKRDVIETVWMPFLENNCNALNVLKARKTKD